MFRVGLNHSRISELCYVISFWRNLTVSLETDVMLLVSDETDLMFANEMPLISEIYLTFIVVDCLMWNT